MTRREDAPLPKDPKDVVETGGSDVNDDGAESAVSEPQPSSPDVQQEVEGALDAQSPTTLAADEPMRQPAPTTAAAHGRGGKRGGPPLLPLLLIAAAVAGAAWLRKRLLPSQLKQGAEGSAPSGTARKASATRKKKLRNDGGGGVAGGENGPAMEVEEVEAPPEPDAMEPMLQVAAVLMPTSEAAGAPLSGLCFVVSEDVEVAGAPTTHGVAAWRELPAPSSGSAAAVQRLVAAGATCLGKTANQPLGLDMLGGNMGSPLNRSRVAGGACTGERTCGCSIGKTPLKAMPPCEQ